MKDWIGSAAVAVLVLIAFVYVLALSGVFPIPEAP